MNKKAYQCIKLANQHKKSSIVMLGLMTKTIRQPAEKTLYCLWRKYGLDKKYDLDIRISLLQQWISILYGQNTDILEIIKKIRQERTKSYQNISNAGGSVSFIDIIDSVIKYKLDLDYYE
ncbi:MAG: hypothetical protein GY814_03275 [Gammaproteobacteria bacterium]|nr:hypothetical protein [Gammaproteobacteria bacterium]